MRRLRLLRGLPKGSPISPPGSHPRPALEGIYYRRLHPDQKTCPISVYFVRPVSIHVHVCTLVLQPEPSGYMKVGG